MIFTLILSMIAVAAALTTGEGHFLHDLLARLRTALARRSADQAGALGLGGDLKRQAGIARAAADQRHSISNKEELIHTPTPIEAVRPQFCG